MGADFVLPAGADFFFRIWEKPAPSLYVRSIVEPGNDEHRGSSKRRPERERAELSNAPLDAI